MFYSSAQPVNSSCHDGPSIRARSHGGVAKCWPGLLPVAPCRATTSARSVPAEVQILEGSRICLKSAGQINESRDAADLSDLAASARHVSRVTMQHLSAKQSRCMQAVLPHSIASACLPWTRTRLRAERERGTRGVRHAAPILARSAPFR